MEFAKLFKVADTQLLLQCVQLENDRCGIEITTVFDDKELTGVLIFKQLDDDGGEANAAELFDNMDQEGAERIYNQLRDDYLMLQKREGVEH